MTFKFSPTSISSIIASNVALRLSTLNCAVVVFALYLSSPPYFTNTDLLPSVKFLTAIVALPSLISPVYVTPSISTVTVPVAPSGTFTVTIASSPTLISSTVTDIEVSYLGTVTLLVVEVPSTFSSPE